MRSRCQRKQKREDDEREVVGKVKEKGVGRMERGQNERERRREGQSREKVSRHSLTVLRS